MITIEAKDKQIFTFGRLNTAPYIEKNPNFVPYFYVEDEDGEFKTIDGKNARKIICNHSKEVAIKRIQFPKTYEADIRYVNRYIIDEIDKIEKEKIRICYLDIETARTDKGYESPIVANNPILSICCYDSFDKKYVQWHGEERKMLQDFLDYISQTDPDMFIAWNGDRFDFPHLVNRIKKLKINISQLSRGEDAYVEKNGFTKVFGRVLFDLMMAYKKMNPGGRESWSLDYISNYENLGSKEKYRGELDDLYKDDLEKFLKYNKRDVELLVLLNEKLRIVEFFDEVRRMCFCRFEDVFMNSKIADCLCLKNVNGKYVLPTSISNPKISYEGAFVHDSDPKLHRDIAAMDMKSLYPAVIIAFNISYETIITEKENDCISIDDKFFFTKTPGLIPSIVRPLLDKRKEVKNEMKKYDVGSREYKSAEIMQYSLKQISNSFYGVLGHRHFRLYKRECASAITYISQKIIKEVMRWFEERELKVVYGDTDSIFLEMGKWNIEQMKQFNNEINEHFKTFFKQFGVENKNNIFELEFEEVYKTIFFKKGSDGKGVKKRYAGRIIYKDDFDVDELGITGFESRRSDSPEVGRAFMKHILKDIVYEIPKEEIDDYIADFKIKIREEFTPEQIGLPMGITKSFGEYKNTPIHIRAAKLANEKHKAQIKQGDKIKYIFVEDLNNVIGWKSEKYMPEGYEIDYNMMIRRIVDLKVGPLYNSLGWDYEWLTFSKKKEKIIKFEDTLAQRELW